jgi:hypothetical protein
MAKTHKSHAHARTAHKTEAQTAEEGRQCCRIHPLKFRPTAHKHISDKVEKAAYPAEILRIFQPARSCSGFGYIVASPVA